MAARAPAPDPEVDADLAYLDAAVGDSGWTVEAVEALALPRQGLRSIAPSAWAPFASLRYLNLARNGLSSTAGMDALVSLEELSLYFNALPDAEAAAAPLRRLRTLRSLDVRMNPLTRREGYRGVLLCLLPRLERLDERDVAPAEQRQARITWGHLTAPPRREAPAAPDDSDEDADDSSELLGLKVLAPETLRRSREENELLLRLEKQLDQLEETAPRPHSSRSHSHSPSRSLRRSPKASPRWRAKPKPKAKPHPMPPSSPDPQHPEPTSPATWLAERHAVEAAATAAASEAAAEVAALRGELQDAMATMTAFMEAAEARAAEERARAAEANRALRESHEVLTRDNEALRRELDDWRARYERDSAAWKRNFKDLKRLYEEATAPA